MDAARRGVARVVGARPPVVAVPAGSCAHLVPARIADRAEVVVVAADAVLQASTAVGGLRDQALRPSAATRPAIEEAAVAGAAGLVGGAFAAGAATHVVRRMNAAARGVERVVRARIPVVAVPVGRGHDEAAERSRAVVPAVVEVVEVAVVTLLARLHDAVPANAPRRGGPLGVGHRPLRRRRRRHGREEVGARRPGRTDQHAGAQGCHRAPELIARARRRVHEGEEERPRRPVEEVRRPGVHGDRVVERRPDEDAPRDHRHRRPELVAGVRARLPEYLQQRPRPAIEEIDGSRRRRVFAVEWRPDDHIAVHQRYRPAEEIALGGGGLAEHPHELPGRDPEEIGSPGPRHAAVPVHGRADQNQIPVHRQRRPEEIARRGGGLLDDPPDLSRRTVE